MARMHVFSPDIACWRRDQLIEALEPNSAPERCPMPPQPASPLAHWALLSSRTPALSWGAAFGARLKRRTLRAICMPSLRACGALTTRTVTAPHGNPCRRARGTNAQDPADSGVQVAQRAQHLVVEGRLLLKCIACFGLRGRGSGEEGDVNFGVQRRGRRTPPARSHPRCHSASSKESVRSTGRARWRRTASGSHVDDCGQTGKVGIVPPPRYLRARGEVSLAGSK